MISRSQPGWFARDAEPGKGNTLRVGDEVEVKPSMIEWYASHLSWCYGQRVAGDRRTSPGRRR